MPRSYEIAPRTCTGGHCGQSSSDLLSRMKNNNPIDKSSRGDNFLNVHQKISEIHKKFKKLGRFEILILKIFENLGFFLIFLKIFENF